MRLIGLRKTDTIAVLAKFKASLKAAVLAGNAEKQIQLDEISAVIEKIKSQPVICSMKGDFFERRSHL